jgi:branched-chain amino acid transport system substrate-binding protein
VKRLFAIVLVLVVVASMVAACGGTPTPAPTAVPVPATAAPAAPTKAPAAAANIKVALVFPMTGDAATFGTSSKEGAELAIKEWNDKGGINGAKIEWVIGDDRCDPQEARNVANKVVTQDKVQFIVGAVCSSASIPLSEVANAAKVIQISPTSTQLKVTVDDKGVVKPYIYRACFIDDFQGLVMANFASNNLKAKTAAVVLDQGNDYVRGLAEVFAAQFEKNGGKVVVKETYTKDDTDFSAILSKVAAAKPDVFFVPDYYAKVSLISKQAKEKGITAVLLGGDGWDSDQLDVKATDGGFYANHYDASDTRPIVVDWLKKYAAAYKDKDGKGKVPDALATLAYDAANLLFTGIKNAGSVDPDKVRAALDSISFDGVSGKITFDKNHNPVKSAVIVGVKDGKKTYAATVNP